MTEANRDKTRKILKDFDLMKVLKELEAREARKEDRAFQYGDVSVCPFTGQIVHKSNDQRFELSDWAIGQFCSDLEMSSRWYRKAPASVKAKDAEWALSVLKNPENPKVFRTLKNEGGTPKIRGIVSSKYSAFEDIEVLSIVNNYLEPNSYEATMWTQEDEGFHLRLALHDTAVRIGNTLDGAPDVHKIGIHIQNGEVGGRSVLIRPMIYRLVCTNGLIYWKTDGEVFKQVHIGIDRDAMREKIVAAIGDSLKMGEKSLDVLKAAKEIEISDPLAAIDKMYKEKPSKHFSKDFVEAVKASYMTEPGKSAFYVIQAITDASKELASDDRVDVERAAFKLLEKYAS